ncbi:hypothetical protein U1Q18_008460, partial [Sarracenia purpurea var. burkii]
MEQHPDHNSSAIPESSDARTNLTNNQSTETLKRIREQNGASVCRNQEGQQSLAEELYDWLQDSLTIGINYA